MSIVEKALRKAQDSRRDLGNDAAGPAAASGPTERRQEEVRGDDAAARRSAVVAPEPPVHRIDIDVAELRAQHLLAPAADEARVRDEYRRVKWPLLEAANGKNVATQRTNLIMVTSSVPNEGKTFTSINLALSIATERDSSVLLIDTDIAKPNITRAFGLTNYKGLVDLLLDETLSLRDVVVGTNIAGLSVLPAGCQHLLGPELLASQRMEQLVNELAELRLGRTVLFDTSPLLATNEAQVLSRLVGQVVMVVKANETPQAAVKEAMALISKTASVAMLLSQCSGYSGTKYYGGYYGYGQE